MMIPPMPASAAAATTTAAAAPAVATSEEADALLAAGISAWLGHEEPEEEEEAEAAAAGLEQPPQQAAPRGRNLGGRPPAREQGKGRPSYDAMLQLQLEARQRRGGADSMKWKVGPRPLPAGKYSQL
jgi:cytochrome P450